MSGRHSISFYRKKTNKEKYGPMVVEKNTLSKRCYPNQIVICELEFQFNKKLKKYESYSRVVGVGIIDRSFIL